MAKTVLVLGAGMTGLPLAHYILKHYAEKFDLKVILISPSNEFFWNIASPRVVLPGQIKNEEVLRSIPEAFSKYAAHRFEFVLGKAEQWNPDTNSVSITFNNTEKRSITYSTLIVATGSQYQDNMPWKLGEDEKKTHEAIAKMRSDIAKANSIVVAGGGSTGVEFTGELGHEYAQKGEKKVTLIMSDSKPFESRVMPTVRNAAIQELEKLGVDVRTDTRIIECTTDKAGKIVMKLANGNGTSLQESNKRLKVDDTLRAPGYHNVFLLGDAANLDSYAAAVREVQVRHVASALGKYFAGLEVPKYTAPDKVTMTVSVGRGRGVGQLGSMKLWSLFIWYFKSRHLCVNIVSEYVVVR